MFCPQVSSEVQWCCCCALSSWSCLLCTGWGRKTRGLTRWMSRTRGRPTTATSGRPRGSFTLRSKRSRFLEPAVKTAFRTLLLGSWRVKCFFRKLDRWNKKKISPFLYCWLKPQKLAKDDDVHCFCSGNVFEWKISRFLRNVLNNAMNVIAKR